MIYLSIYILFTKLKGPHLHIDLFLQPLYFIKASHSLTYGDLCISVYCFVRIHKLTITN